MRRKRKQATGLAVSLFPFLAVLICTMGVLIVMLVLAVKSSAVKAQQAKRDHAEDVRSERDELLDQLDLEQFRVEAISKMRPGLTDRLAEEKLRRSHIDDEIRRLVEEVKVLSEQFRQLVADESELVGSQAADSDKVADLQQKIIDRRGELERLRQSVAGRPVMYSIVPTRSTGGTTRRPIYVECTASGIALQPSGIQLRLDEFTKPILPGNPLDAALLATREYWNKYDAGSSDGEPYPLIVVRPGGATAYAIARRAMTSWDDEFGYELVESEKQLNWGAADPNLAESLKQAIAISKQRQAQSVAAGVASWLSTGAGRLDEGFGGQPLSNGTELGTGRSTNSNSDPAAFQTGTGGSKGNSEHNLVADQSSGFGAGTSHKGTSHKGTSRTGTGSGGLLESMQPRPGIDTSKDDSLSRFASVGRRSSGSGNPLRPGQPNPSSTSSAGQEGGNSNGLAQSGTPSMSARASQTQPLSHQRGADWALPTRTPGATPYRRPIRVDCLEDYYVIHPSDTERDAVRVPISEAVDVAIDELVNQVWRQIEGWGMAEIGGFWKPVLRLTTRDIQGAARADELARKLENSGIEIERQWR